MNQPLEILKANDFTSQNKPNFDFNILDDNSQNINSEELKKVFGSPNNQEKKIEEIKKPKEETNANQEQPKVIVKDDEEILKDLHKLGGEINEEVEDENIQETESNVFKVHAEKFKEIGLLDIPEDYKLESEEDYINLWNKNKEEQANKLIATEFEAHPQKELALELYNYIKLGKDISVFLEVNQDPLKGVDLKNEKDQEEVIRMNLKNTTSLSDDRINKKIEQYKESKVLEEEAKDAFDNLDTQFKLQAKNKALLEQKRIEDEAREEQAATKEVIEYIEKNDLIKDTFNIKAEKKPFLDFLYKKTERLPNGVYVSKSDLLDMNLTPDQHLFLKYLQFKNYAVDEIKKESKKEAKKDFLKALEKSSEGRIKGSGKAKELTDRRQGAPVDDFQAFGNLLQNLKGQRII